MPGVLRTQYQVHLDEEVAREELLPDHLLLAPLAELHHLLGGDQDLKDLVLKAEGLDALLQVGLGLLLLPHQGVDRVPLYAHRRSPIRKRKTVS